MAELHVYDFDGTLFRSPAPPPDWKGTGAWYNDESSLDRPYVPEKPGPDFWIADTVASARQSIANPDVLAVCVTGRSNRQVFKYRVPELLRGAGLHFDDIYLNPGTDTAGFKKRVIWMLLQRHPSIDTVQIWEDNLINLREYIQFAQRAGVKAIPHAVRTTKRPVIAKHSGRVARIPTPESRAWERDKRAKAKHVADAVRAFVPLLETLRPFADQATKAFPGKDKESLASRSRTFVKLVKDNPTLKTYLDTWIGTDQHHPQAYSWRSTIIYRIRDHLLFPDKFPLRKTLEEVKKQADKGFEAVTMALAQAPLRRVLPEEVRMFLPKNIVVEVDHDGTIRQVTDRFENEHETLGVKIRTQHQLIRQYNAIVQQVKKDMESGDEMTRMAALVTAIIMETGIRPGKEGNHIVKMENGQEVDIETFGATTLGPQHVRFVRDFAELEFTGKKGTTNIATLTNPQVLALLKAYVEQAKKGGSTMIFITKAGVPFTYKDLAHYFRTKFAAFSPTDFRKLKATETVLENLRTEQVSLYRRIRAFAKQKAKDLKERVTAEVVGSIQTAYENAQRALSHESVDVTIRAYVNPEVVLRFLSQGQIEDSLERAILTGKQRLAFDPDVFVQRALETAKIASGKTLQNLLDELAVETGTHTDSASRVAWAWLSRI